MRFEGKVVGWHGVLVTFVATLALVATIVIYNLFLTVWACKVEHGSLLGAIWHKDPSQFNEEVAVERLALLHFLTLLTMLFYLTDHHNVINSSSISCCKRAYGRLITGAPSAFLPFFELTSPLVWQPNDGVS